MKRILLALALLSPALAGAQDLSHPWILQECLDWALEHNLNVKQSELNVAQREIQLNTSKNAYFPNVSGSANESVNFGRGLTEDNTYTTGATTTNTSFSIGAGMNLFDGMARPNNVKLSQLNLDAALADLERARDDIRVSVAKAYVQVVYDYDIVDVARDQQKLDQAQVERLQAMVENGKASQAELSQQKATLAQSDYTLVQAENNLRNALLDLSQLLDFPNADGFSIVKPEIAVGDHLLARPEDIYADAVEQRPGVKAEQLRLKGSDLSIKIAKAGFSPTLSLSGGMGTSYYTNTRSLYPQDGSGPKAEQPDALVISTAVENDNVDLIALPNCPVIHRATALAQALDRIGVPQIAVAGSCGKTSVTGWIAAALKALGKRVLMVDGGYTAW